jgi:hypothetical protein
VLLRDEAIDEGRFGATVLDQHRDRIGDVVVICREPVAVLATAHEPPTVAKLVGFHGALTPVEVEVPLIAVLPRG